MQSRFSIDGGQEAHCVPSARVRVCADLRFFLLLDDCFVLLAHYSFKTIWRPWTELHEDGVWQFGGDWVSGGGARCLGNVCPGADVTNTETWVPLWALHTEVQGPAPLAPRPGASPPACSPHNLSRGPRWQILQPTPLTRSEAWVMVGARALEEENKALDS